MTVKQVHKRCPTSKKILIGGEFLCVPMLWKSPTTKQISGPFFIHVHRNTAIEIKIDGSLAAVYSTNTEHYLPAWEKL